MCRMGCRIFFIFFLLAAALGLDLTARVSADDLNVVPTGPLLPPELAAIVPMLSGMPMLLAADSLGITQIMGKDVSTRSQQASKDGPKRLIDVAIANDPVKHENEPSVTTSPKDKKKLVVGNHVFGTGVTGVRCEERHSSDGGATWSAPFLMPQLPGGECSDPVLYYAPDGSRVYYAYMDIKSSGWDIVVNYSNDNGATWLATPVVALQSTGNPWVYDKPWISAANDLANFVYVTATRFDVGPQCHIAFTRSTDGGVSYEPPQILESSVVPCVGGVGGRVVQGSRPAAGRGGNLLVAWYNSGSDGWLVGSFETHTRYSANFGAAGSFAPVAVASTDSFELPYFLGPGSCYHRWWGAMFPDVEIDPSQSAHVGYTHDPVAGSATPEDGDIRYATSAGPPYTSWSTPVTVNDDGTPGHAQGYVALDIQTDQTGQSAVVHAVWEDHRLSTGAGQCFGDPVGLNLYYDIFASRKPPGEGWKPNFIVNEQPSISDFLFIGDYIDLTTDNGSVFAVWTDRREKASIFDFEDDVYGSRWIATKGTP